MKRLNIGCSNCGWNITSCDIHHIIPRSKNGSDAHSNLSNLCPNCHRCAHAGLLDKFVTLEEQIGEKWKECYFYKKSPKHTNNNFDVYNRNKRKSADIKSTGVLNNLKCSKIDFTKYGWVKQAAVIIGIQPNKVQWWLKRYDPEFLDSCYTRK